MRTSHRSLIGLVVLSLGLAAGIARADPPCLADIQKFCGDTPANGGKIQACLKAHEKDLSDGCKKTLVDLRRKAGTLAAVCNFDIARFCGDVSPGGGRVAVCLKEHRDDLSPECKNRFGKRQ